MVLVYLKVLNKCRRPCQELWDSCVIVGFVYNSLRINFLTESFQSYSGFIKSVRPLLKTLGEFVEFVGKYIADALLFIIGLLSEFINYLNQDRTRFSTT